MKSSIVLYLGIGLIAFGLFQPNISNLLVSPNNNTTTCLDHYVLTPPTDPAILAKCQKVVDIVQKSNVDNKKFDMLRLSSLTADIATLIRLNGDNVIVDNTKTLRQINSVCGQMLNLDIKGKYVDLAKACEDVVIAAIGDKEINLSDDDREKAAQAFDGLSWAYYQGSK